jgi:hypothetical protein
LDEGEQQLGCHLPKCPINLEIENFRHFFFPICWKKQTIDREKFLVFGKVKGRRRASSLNPKIKIATEDENSGEAHHVTQECP